MVKKGNPAAPRGARKLEILQSAEKVLRQKSLTVWSIDMVAKEAHCAKGLVIHYFRGRDQLLSTVGAALASDRETMWLGALTGQGIADLDALWAVLLKSAGDGSARALLELRLAGTASATLAPSVADRLRAALARALETTPDELPAAAALEGILEGYLLALLGRSDEAQVREAFFRYWVTLVG